MNVDEIVKERLQERIGSVVEEYRSGDLRAEVEAELKKKQLKEKICNIFKWENISGFNYDLYTLGLALSKNKTYYYSLLKMGNRYYYEESKRAARFVLRILFLILIVASYVYGWTLLDELKVEYANRTAEQTYPFSLLLAYAFLGVAPFAICFGYIIEISKRPLYIVITVLMFAWLMYVILFFFPALFPQWEILWWDICLSLLIGAVITYIVTSVCMIICYAIYS